MDNIPLEIIVDILSFISESKYWLSVKLTCKKFLQASIKAFDPSIHDNYAIQWASKNGYLEVVQELLKDNRVDPSANNNYAIQWASNNGHLEVVQELLKDNRVDPSERQLCNSMGK